MDCRRFDDWLDAGRPAADAGDASAHRAACADCAARATGDDGLERALASRGTDPGDAFTAAVMSRLPAARREIAPAVDPDLVLPWWAQLLREPEAALGLALGAVYAGATPWLVPRLLEVVPKLTAGGLPAIPDGGMSPLSLAMLVLPVLGAATWIVYRVMHAAFSRIGAVS